MLTIRIDKKDFINQLRGLSDNYIQLIINPENRNEINLKDSRHFYTIQTRQ